MGKSVATPFTHLYQISSPVPINIGHLWKEENDQHDEVCCSHSRISLLNKDNFLGNEACRKSMLE